MKKNKDIKRRWILAILWMVFIFVMSQVPGEQSSKQSGFIIYVFSLFGLDLNSIWGELANYIIRKGAHFTEYFILYILIYRVLIIYYSRSKALLLGILSVFFYACTDEFHQWFVDGRVAAFKDVLIDTAGGTFSAVVTMIIYKLKDKRSKIHALA